MSIDPSDRAHRIRALTIMTDTSLGQRHAYLGRAAPAYVAHQHRDWRRLTRMPGPLGARHRYRGQTCPQGSGGWGGLPGECSLWLSSVIESQAGIVRYSLLKQ
jgi:hypothetical protein